MTRSETGQGHPPLKAARRHKVVQGQVLHLYRASKRLYHVKQDRGNYGLYLYLVKMYRAIYAMGLADWTLGTDVRQLIVLKGVLGIGFVLTDVSSYLDRLLHSFTALYPIVKSYGTYTYYLNGTAGSVGLFLHVTHGNVRASSKTCTTLASGLGIYSGVFASLFSRYKVINHMLLKGLRTKLGNEATTVRLGHASHYSGGGNEKLGAQYATLSVPRLLGTSVYARSTLHSIMVTRATASRINGCKTLSSDWIDGKSYVSRRQLALYHLRGIELRDACRPYDRYTVGLRVTDHCKVSLLIIDRSGADRTVARVLRVAYGYRGHRGLANGESVRTQFRLGTVRLTTTASSSVTGDLDTRIRHPTRLGTIEVSVRATRLHLNGALIVVIVLILRADHRYGRYRIINVHCNVSVANGAREREDRERTLQRATTNDETLGIGNEATQKLTGDAKSVLSSYARALSGARRHHHLALARKHQVSDHGIGVLHLTFFGAVGRQCKVGLNCIEARESGLFTLGTRFLHSFDGKFRHQLGDNNGLPILRFN